MFRGSLRITRTFPDFFQKYLNFHILDTLVPRIHYLKFPYHWKPNFPMFPPLRLFAGWYAVGPSLELRYFEHYIRDWSLAYSFMYRATGWVGRDVVAHG